MGVEVVADDEQDDHPVDAAHLAELARGVLVAEGVTGEGQLSLTFVDEQAMADLNRRFAGGDGPTDVLAFPLDDVHASDQALRLLGDVLICPAVAHRNASDQRRSDEDEMALLVVHGVLHIMGMDHDDPVEAQAMQRRETELLARFHRPAARAQP
jgi:probable rRNA maturation factor